MGQKVRRVSRGDTRIAECDGARQHRRTANGKNRWSNAIAFNLEKRQIKIRMQNPVAIGRFENVAFRLTQPDKCDVLPRIDVMLCSNYYGFLAIEFISSEKPGPCMLITAFSNVDSR
jgi:hypothetical protein